MLKAGCQWNRLVNGGRSSGGGSASVIRALERQTDPLFRQCGMVLD
jgi:hypothetical protein